MRLVKVAAVSMNTVIGDFEGNTNKIIRYIENAKAQNISLIVFPELSVCGYSPEDLVYWKTFIDGNWEALERIKPYTKGIAACVGVVIAYQGEVFNGAAMFHDGELLGITLKENLPTYNVFYEGRTFSKGFEQMYVEINGVPAGDIMYELDFGVVAAEVCEDVWSIEGPYKRRAISGAEIICNLSASPFRSGIIERRRGILATRSEDLNVAYVYANMIGSNTRLVFDGGSGIFYNGKILASSTRFEEGMAVKEIDLDRVEKARRENTTWKQGTYEYRQHQKMTPRIVSKGKTANQDKLRYSFPVEKNLFIPDRCEQQISIQEAYYEELLQALILGVKDYYEKTKAFKKIGIALSGGKDSALATLVSYFMIKKRYSHLTEEEQRQKVQEELDCFYLPTEKYSSQETRNVSKELCEELGIPFKIISIQDTFDLHSKKLDEMLREDEEITPIAKQNIQARIRGAWMWNWSNSTQGMILVTSNMSEGAVGYTTLGGDAEGAFAPFSNLPKTVIIGILNYIYEKYGIHGAKAVNDLPPTAELAEDQTDEKDLMPYEILDNIMYLYVHEKLHPLEIVDVMSSKYNIEREQMKQYVRKFIRLFCIVQYKREQFAVGLKLFEADLDPKTGLRFPVVQDIESQLKALEE